MVLMKSIAVLASDIMIGDEGFIFPIKIAIKWGYTLDKPKCHIVGSTSQKIAIKYVHEV